ncbi:pantetheinase-like isoform X2 [Mixophyes fleayi]|uniref:pantetheinase-like isoform X2 n=1 Tax=Mixophyes fleayi TaxID=3061075 RepID=UPI003F4E3600
MVTTYILLRSMLLFAANCQALDTFIAAVYEHAVILADDTKSPISSHEALDLMNRNMDILEDAVKTAAMQGAHLIVTPEDGIYGWRFNRETIYPFLEDIPDPKVNWNPCSDPARFGQAPVQTRLSCMARDNSIYVVANIGDKKLCNISDVGCPDDGQYNYNTAVVYDSNGKLVARYHKGTLEDRDLWVPGGKVHPALRRFLVNIGESIRHCTSWSACANQGSGIFSPDKVEPYYYNMKNETGGLLISELRSHPRNSSTYTPTKWNLYASHIEKYRSGSNVFNGFIFDDNYTFTELNANHGEYTVCQKNLCCHISYKMVEKHSDEVYVFGVFNGLHLVEGEYYLQVCTLLKCESMDLKSCGEPVETSSTRFESFSLSGNFSTSFVFPEVLLTDVHLAPNMFQVLNDGRLISQSGISSHPLLSATLFGRWYEKDPIGKQKSKFIM